MPLPVPNRERIVTTMRIGVLGELAVEGEEDIVVGRGVGSRS